MSETPAERVERLRERWQFAYGADLEVVWLIDVAEAALKVVAAIPGARHGGGGFPVVGRLADVLERAPDGNAGNAEPGEELDMALRDNLRPVNRAPVDPET